MKEQISIMQAISRVRQIFPFPCYMHERSEVYKNISETVIRHLEPGSTILDFGSGPCDKTAILQFLGYSCSAWDDLMDEWHKMEGNRNKILSFADGCGIHFKKIDGNLPPFQGGVFDMIMLHDVLEHLHNSPRNLLNGLLEFLKPGGLLFITVPSAVNIRKRIHVLCGKTNLPRFESFYWYPDPWRGHIREYVRDDLLCLSKYLDLEILELRSCDHMLEKLPTGIIRSIYLIATSIFPGWKDSWLLVARKPGHWIPRKSMPKEELVAISGR